jgi:hypothetical protein
MRKDINQRFLETRKRYKLGKFPRSTKKLNKADEDGQADCPSGMKKAHVLSGWWDYGGGGYGDYALLSRWLQSKVGKPWDDVHSEVCGNSDARSWAGHRLREALDSLVEQNCTLDADGTLRDDRGHELLGWRRHQFYVHPETKKLEEVSRKRHHWKKDIKQTVFEMDGQLYHDHNGIWFRVEMKPVPKEKQGSYSIHSRWFTDAFRANAEPKTLDERRYWNWWGWTDALKRKYGLSPEGELWYCCGKQSANSKEIERLKKKHKLDE